MLQVLRCVALRSRIETGLPTRIPDPHGSYTRYGTRSSSLALGVYTHEVDIVVADTPVPASMKINAFHHLVIDCDIVLLAQGNLARSLRSNFPASLNGAPLLLPKRGSVFRQNIDYSLAENDVLPTVRAEFDDTGIMKIAAAHGHGAVLVPEIIVKEVCKDYHLERVGKLAGLRYKLYLISLERRIKHPVVASMM